MEKDPALEQEFISTVQQNKQIIYKVCYMPLALLFIAFYMFELHTTTDILKEKSFWITLAILMPIVFYTCILKFRSTFRSLKIIEKSIADIKEFKS